MKRLAEITILCLTLGGCQSLLITPQDDALDVTGKVSARVLLGVSTFGISEMHYGFLKREIAVEEEVEKYKNLLQRRVDAGEMTPLEAEERMVMYHRQLWADYQAQRQRMAASMQNQLATPRNCNTTYWGNTASTRCY